MFQFQKTLATLVALMLIHAAAAPSARAQDTLPQPEFTPYTVAPVLRNMEDVRDALIREYPTELRDAGIGGRVNVWMYITTDGRARYLQVAESSGVEALDAAALRVAEVYDFEPAMNRDRRVPVWVSLPVTFAIPVRRAPR